MMFKCSKDLVPLPIVELFTRNYEFHNHYTRQSQSLHTAVGRNEAIYKTFTFHGRRAKLGQIQGGCRGPAKIRQMQYAIFF